MAHGTTKNTRPMMEERVTLLGLRMEEAVYCTTSTDTSDLWYWAVQ